MFVGVFDERLKVIVSSCGWTPFHDYYAGNITGWTSDRYMPRLRDGYGLDPNRVPFDFYEVVAASRRGPSSRTRRCADKNFDVQGVKKGVAAAEKVYELLGAGDRLQVRYPDCGHDFPVETRREAYQFIDKILGACADRRRARDRGEELAPEPVHTSPGGVCDGDAADYPLKSCLEVHLRVPRCPAQPLAAFFRETLFMDRTLRRRTMLAQSGIAIGAALGEHRRGRARGKRRRRTTASRSSTASTPARSAARI